MWYRNTGHHNVNLSKERNAYKHTFSYSTIFADVGDTVGEGIARVTHIATIHRSSQFVLQETQSHFSLRDP